VKKLADEGCNLTIAMKGERRFPCKLDSDLLVEANLKQFPYGSVRR